MVNFRNTFPVMVQARLRVKLHTGGETDIRATPSFLRDVKLLLVIEK